MADTMFTDPPKERAFPTTAVGIAAVAILIVVGVFVMLGHRKAQPIGDANYAAHIAITNVEVSAASNQLGGTSTYVDGHVTNNGTLPVTGLFLQATFNSDSGAAPQIETDSAAIIRTRDPIVDLQPLSAAPLAPGASADFRLVFETIKDGWDQKTPELRIAAVTTSK